MSEGSNSMNQWYPMNAGSAKWESDSMSVSSFGGLRSRDSTKVSTEAQEAELIASATAQAMIAARSIILSGGTQATALSTAKAAAQSVMLLNSQNFVANANFLRRRKAKRQASIIASMALGSVNNTLQHDFSTRSNGRSVTEGQGNNRDMDVTQMLLQGRLPSYLLNDNEFFPQSPATQMSSVMGITSTREPTSSPQPSTVATTVSGRQSNTTMQSSTVESIGSKGTPGSGAKTANVSSIGEVVTRAKDTEKTLGIFEDNPTVANILNGLVSMSEVGSTTSPQAGQSESMNGRKLPSEMPQNRPKHKDVIYQFPEEDPIYDTTQELAGKRESKPNEVSRRMEKFLKSTYSHEDSCTSEGSANFSRDSTLFRSLESEMDDTGTVDSGTVESETIGSATYDEAEMTHRGHDGESVFGIGASTVFSSIAENFFCSPYPKTPRFSSGLRGKADLRDESECRRTSTARRPSGRSSGSESRDRDRNDTDDEGYPYSVADSDDMNFKKISFQDTMEQLVLRALSAAPSPVPGPSSELSQTQTYNSMKLDDSVEAKGPSVVESGSHATGFDSAGSKSRGLSVEQGSRKIRLPMMWIRNKKNDKNFHSKDVE